MITRIQIFLTIVFLSLSYLFCLLVPLLLLFPFYLSLLLAPLSLSRARTRTHASSARSFLCLVTPCSFSSSIFLRLLNFSTDSAAAEYLLAFFSISSALNFLPGHCQCQCQCISPLFHLHTARLSASDRKLQFTVFDCIQIMWNGWK